MESSLTTSTIENTRGIVTTNTFAAFVLAVFVAATVVLTPSVGNAQRTGEEYMQEACAVNKEACEGGSELARRIVPCLQLPTNEPSSYTMLARVMLENEEVSYLLIGFDEKQISAWEMKAADVIADAITDCQPYAGLSGPVVFLFTPTLLQSRWR